VPPGERALSSKPTPWNLPGTDVVYRRARPRSHSAWLMVIPLDSAEPVGPGGELAQNPLHLQREKRQHVPGAALRVRAKSWRKIRCTCNARSANMSPAPLCGSGPKVGAKSVAPATRKAPTCPRRRSVGPGGGCGTRSQNRLMLRFDLRHAICGFSVAIEGGVRVARPTLGPVIRHRRLSMDRAAASLQNMLACPPIEPKRLAG
jgi:hypothetical protein